MIPDPTDEIRAIRNRLAATCNYDLDRIVEEARQHQRDSGQRLRHIEPGRRCGRGDEPTDAAERGFCRVRVETGRDVASIGKMG